MEKGKSVIQKMSEHWGRGSSAWKRSKCKFNAVKWKWANRKKKKLEKRLEIGPTCVSWPPLCRMGTKKIVPSPTHIP